MPPTSPTARTPSSASTTCATTWPPALEDKVQRGHPFGVVDEVDKILIDEARTPLIISGAPEQAADLYKRFAKLAPMMESGKKPEGLDPRSKKDYVSDFDFEFDEKHKQVSVTERGVAKAEKFLGHRPPLPRRERPPRQPPPAGAEGRVALQARRRLRGDRRRGPHHRRVHRAHPRGPALVGGAAPGRRGQGGRARPGGEPDARDHHAAELLPPLRQALGHDRHRPHRGDRVHEDLQARRGADPHQPPDGPRRPQRSGLQDQGRQVACRGGRDRGAPQGRPAGPRRHHLRRGLRAALRAAQAQGHPAHGAQRQARVRRARRRDRGRGRPARRGHHRHQHGRPRRRHQARRQRRAPHRPRAGQARPAPRRSRLRRALRRDPAEHRGARAGGPREGRRRGRPVHHRHRAPRVAPHRQPAARALRPPGRSRRVALLPVRRGRPRPPVRRRPHLPHPRPPRQHRRGGRTRSPSRRGC